MSFLIEFHYVAMSDVESEVKHVFEEQSKYIPSYDMGFKNFFMALLEDDLAFFKEHVHSEHPLKQMNSKFSIIAIEDPDKSHSVLKVYKIVPNVVESSVLHLLIKEVSTVKQHHLAIPRGEIHPTQNPCACVL